MPVTESRVGFKRKLRHANFLKKVPKELGESNALKFEGAYLAGNGEEQAQIRVQVEDGHVVLSYRTRINFGEWHTIELPVLLTYSPCNYGGARVWFRGPICSRRAAKLFCYGKYFICRKCTGQLYESQSEWGAT